MALRGLFTLLASGGAAALVARRVLRQRRPADLTGQVVLVTGSSRGLGFLLAQEFAREGCRIVMCARDPQRLEQARASVAALGAEVLAQPCDVRDRHAVQRLVDRATSHFGRIDILVCNAGIMTMAPIEELRIEDFEASMDTMFWGTVYPTLAVLPSMIERGDGRIVNISSIGGKIAAPHLLPYSSAKFAVAGFSEGLATEVRKRGVDVLTVVPGFMRTGSPYNAWFGGQHRQEFTLFSLMGNLPLTSTNAPGAARQIVEATKRGETELIITPQARLAASVHGLFPGATVWLLAAVARLLPGPREHPPEDGARFTRGYDSETAVTESFLLALGRRAARRYQEQPPPRASASGRD